MGTSNNSKYVIVSVDGTEANKISITGSEKNQVYIFLYGNQKSFIKIHEGSVKMLEMSKEVCLKGICSEGWISKKYQTIVCLPNKITVSFDYPQKEELDTISILRRSKNELGKKESRI